MRKRYPPPQRQMIVFVCIITWMLMFMNKSNGQEPVVTITAGSEVGCMYFETSEDRLKYAELIQEYGECSSTCEHSIVTYTLTGDSSSWINTNWSVTGGTIVGNPTLTQVTIEWHDAGFGTLDAQIETYDGIIDVPARCIQIKKGPKSHFYKGPEGVTMACVDEIISFFNNSNPDGGAPLVSYYWDFGDGSTSSAFEPTHSYTSSGQYEVSLTVTNACNCSHTSTITIEVGEQGINIQCPSVVCEGQRASYSVPQLDGLCSQYEWNVVGGTIVSPSPYTSEVMIDWDILDPTGFGYVTFNTFNCEVNCPSLASIKVPVIQTVGYIQGETLVCAGSQYIYKLPQWPTTDFTWTLDDNGTNATLLTTDQPNEVIITTQDPGYIKLRATYHNSLVDCGGSAEITIQILDEVQIVGQQLVCEGDEVAYTLSNNQAADWVLVTPNGTLAPVTVTNFTHAFSTPGNYILSATGSTFCAPEPLSITVLEKPNAVTAITGPLTVCPDTPITYSVTNNDPNTVIGWDIIGGAGTIIGSNYGNQVTIVFDPLYTQPYVIRTWRESTEEPNCPSDILMTTVNKISVDFTITGPAEVCSSSVASFSTAYTGGDVYNWTIQNPNLGSVVANGTQNATIVWNNVSVNQMTKVFLSITRCGITETESIDVEVTTAPSFTISAPSQICRGENITFTISPSVTLNTGTIEWQLGNGNSVIRDIATQGLSYTYTYNNIDSNNLNYEVTATITGANGCTATGVATHSVTVLPAIVAQITPDIDHAYCLASEIDILFTVTIQSGTPVVGGIKWYRNGVHLVNEDDNTTIDPAIYGFGNYYAELFNSNGCSIETNNVDITVSCPTPGCSNPPELTVSATNDCGTITAAGSYTGTVTQVTWGHNSLDLVSSNNTAAVFTTDDAGTFDILYIVGYMSGSTLCEAQINTSIEVPYIPDVKYEVTCGSAPNTYRVELFDNSSYIPTAIGTPIAITVTGPGGTTTVNPDVNGDYIINLAPDTYVVELTINGANPCSEAITLDLPDMPDATFTVSNQVSCKNESVEFTPADTTPGNQYVWDFGDGESYSGQIPPSREYVNADFYTPSLTVTNKYGCSATYTLPQQIVIKAVDLAGEFTENNLYGCSGQVLTLNYDPINGNPVLYTWLQDGNFLGTTTIPQYTVTQNGKYTVETTNNNGCITRNTDYINVTIVTIPEPVIQGPLSVCEGEVFELNGSVGQGSYEYQWEIVGAGIVQPFSPQPVLEQAGLAPGEHEYIVTVRIDRGDGTYCTSTATHTVTILPEPAAPQIAPPVMMDCELYQMKLEADAGQPGTYTWSNGMTGQSIIVYSGGPYLVTFTAESGCTSTAQIYVPKDPEEYMWIFPSGCYEFCRNFSEYGATLLPPMPDFVNWEWLQDGSGASSGSNGPVLPFHFSDPGSYNLYLYNGMCDATSEPMDLEILEECNCELKAQIDGVDSYTEGYCYYEIHMFIDNPDSTDLAVTLTTPGGFFNPATVIVPPGGANVAVTMVADGFAGGVVMVTLSALNEKGEICTLQLEVDLPPCEGAARMAPDGKDGEDAVTTMVIAPNPAQNQTEVAYSFTNEPGHTRSIQVYSLMGILLESIEPTEPRGVWQLDMERYAGGNYIVVMKEDGIILHQNNIILQK